MNSQDRENEGEAVKDATARAQHDVDEMLTTIFSLKGPLYGRVINCSFRMGLLLSSMNGHVVGNGNVSPSQLKELQEAAEAYMKEMMSLFCIGLMAREKVEGDIKNEDLDALAAQIDKDIVALHEKVIQHLFEKHRGNGNTH